MNLIKSLQDSGHAVYVIAPFDEYTEKVKSKGVMFEEISMNIKGKNPFQDLFLIHQYAKLLKKIQPNVILTFTIKPTIYGNIAARFFRIKVISNITGLGTIFIKPSLSTNIAAILYKISLLKCHKVFFQNQTDYRFFRKSGFVKKQQAVIIPGSGIDVNKFKITQRSFNTENLKILFVGRIIKDKGVVEFLKAAREIKQLNKNILFYVVGKLGYENHTALKEKEFQEYIDDNTIEYLNHSDNILDVYKKSDIMVLPSYREGMSRALLEAASMSMPLITTDVPGCREIVNNEVNGYLIKVRSIKDLTLKLKKIINLTEKDLILMGQESRKLIEENFSEELVIKKYLNEINATI